MRALVLLVAVLPAFGHGVPLPTSSVPVPFEPNAGQADPSALFLSRAAGWCLSLTRTGAFVQTAQSRIEIEFAGSNPAVDVLGVNPLEGRLNFLHGARQDWRTNLPLYSRVEYRGVYPGIDVAFYNDKQQREYDWIVRPGGSASRIRVRFKGITRMWVDKTGQLVQVVPDGHLVHARPVAYQMRNGHRRSVPARFQILPSGDVRFVIGQYDTSRTLVIDPTLDFSAYLGSSGGSAATGIAADNAGNLYVTGYTTGTNLPGPSRFNLAYGGVDVFVMKLEGSTIRFVTYLGGSGDDRALGVAVDSAGKLIVVGNTESPDFPTIAAVQPVFGGAQDAFVARLNETGDRIEFSTFWGGTGSDSANAVALGSAGDIFVAGTTSSANFPTLNPVYPTNHGGDDGFVSRFSSTGIPIYSTFIGGSQNDSVRGIAVDAQGNTYITGGTFSTDLPVVNAFQRANAGGQDAFVARLNSTGTALPFCTYVGGSGGSVTFGESGTAIAADSTFVYVAGVTSSINFPLTTGAVSTQLGGSLDGFFVKIRVSDGSLTSSTYVGGSAVDGAAAIAVDPISGTAYISGYSASTDFPSQLSIQNAPGGGDYDTFVAAISPSGQLTFATYLGGSASDAANGIAWDSAHVRICIAGQTKSTNYPVAGASFQSGLTSSISGVVSCIGRFPLDPPSLISPVSGTALSGRINLSWTAVPRADDYRVEIGTTQNSADILTTTTGALTSTVADLSPFTSSLVYIRLFSVSNTTGLSAAKSYTFSASACTYSITPAAPVYAYLAAQVNLSVTTAPACTWSISSPNNWVSISQTTGIGAGSVNISVPANTGSPRAGVVNAAGKFLTIYQPGPTCTPSVAPSQPVGPAGGTYALNVQYSNGGNGCAWNAVSQSSALRVTAATGVGNGVLSITVDPNNTVSQRQLTLTVGGQLTTLTQSGQSTSPFDFNGDRQIDLVWQDPNTGTSQIWFLGGPQHVSIVGAANVTGSNSWRIVAAGDFDGDGKPDLVWQSPATGQSQIWYLGGPQGATITGSSNLTASNPWRIVASGDFNGDGKRDLLWQDPATGHAQIWFLGGPQGNVITDAANLTNSNPWHIVGAGDFNGDGKLDIVWQDLSSGASQVWFMGGDRGNVVVDAVGLTGPNPWRIMSVADYDSDGHPDLVWQDPANGFSQTWFMAGAKGTTIISAATLTNSNPWRLASPR